MKKSIRKVHAKHPREKSARKVRAKGPCKDPTRVPVRLICWRGSRLEGGASQGLRRESGPILRTMLVRKLRRESVEHAKVEGGHFPQLQMKEDSAPLLSSTPTYNAHQNGSV